MTVHLCVESGAATLRLRHALGVGRHGVLKSTQKVRRMNREPGTTLSRVDLHIVWEIFSSISDELTF